MVSAEYISESRQLDQLAINTIRFLSVDAVQKANSGHPGLPLDAAPMAYALWTKFLRHNPAHSQWFNRDRFVLSAGHGSMLLYSLLHLTGYPVSLDQIKQFRQWGSITPGHPERNLTPGVETTTGPLGQGFGASVGLAMAEAHLAARYNQPNFQIVDHFTFGIASDGDLMEGVSSEAASLAGHLKLGKLVYFYDCNHVTLSEGIQLSFSEDCAKRFDAYGWQVLEVEDGNDIDALEDATTKACSELDRPSLIIVKTLIGYGAPHKQGTYEAHGSPLGEEEVRLTKEALDWPPDKTFHIPTDVEMHFRKAIGRGEELESAWNTLCADYRQAHPELYAEFHKLINGELPSNWDSDIASFTPDEKGMATRSASGKVLQAIFPKLPGLIGGSGDLNPSTRSELKEAGDFEHPSMAKGDLQGSSGGGYGYSGRNIHFGVREHAMGAICNGLAVHGGLIPYAATFLTFSDYMRPAIRIAAVMEAQVIYLFTHDSIGLGEDGPTHQSVEHLASLRAIPNLIVIRPADANETAVAWRVAIETKNKPVALILTRQNVPVLDRSSLASAERLRFGGYVLFEPQASKPDLILIASGSEVNLVVKAAQKLEGQGIRARVVSMPSWELFESQAQDYKASVLPPELTARLSVEAGVGQGWHKYVGEAGDILSIERFGASAPGEIVMQELGFSVENICRRALALIGRAP